MDPNNPLFYLARRLVESFLIPSMIGVVCGYFMLRQARKSHNRREFLNQVNFSLNIVTGGRLLIRTLIERPCADVFLNPVLTKLVLKAAQQTTKDNCLLPIRNRNDYWLCLNELLNEVSQRFADGFVKLDLDPNVRREVYLMCITCEVSDHIRTRKIRVMLIKKSLLLDFPATDPAVDFPTHTTRILTLRQLARAYQSEEWKHCFVEIELCA